MDKTEIRIASDVIARLVNQTDVAFLLGWAEGNTIICTGCARDIQEWKNISDFRDSAQQTVALFPAGIGIVGLSQRCSEEEAVDRSQSLFKQFLSSGVEDCTVGPILAFVYRPLAEEDAKDDLSQHALAFDTRIAKSVQALLTIAEGSSLVANTILLRIRGNMPLTFEATKNSNEVQNNLEKAMLKIKEKVASAACIYLLQNSNVMIRNCLKAVFNHPKLKSNSKCSALIGCIEENSDDDGFQLGKQKKKYLNAQNKVLNVKMMMQSTGDAAIQHTLSCSPIIHYERREFMDVSMNLGIDVVAMVPSAMSLNSLPSLIANGINAQLSAMQQTLHKFYPGGYQVPMVYHYLLPSWHHTISSTYPKQLPDSELEAYRREMHLRLLLPLEWPLFRKAMRHSFPDDLPKGGYLFNVHLGLPPSGVTDGQVCLVRGTYAYHHYMQDRTDDNGWGCAYRSLQTLISWFVHQGYTSAPIPTHQEIQQALVDIGDKPPSFVKSKKWIGSMEVSYCLDKLIGVSSKIIAVSSGAELAGKGRELLYHFCVHGTPIMIGGGVLAHTILGADVNLKTGDIKFLILDPHYTGAEDLSLIHAKGWCGWKGPEFWDQTAYYNLCCPQRPLGI